MLQVTKKITTKIMSTCTVYIETARGFNEDVKYGMIVIMNLYGTI